MKARTGSEPALAKMQHTATVAMSAEPATIRVVLVEDCVTDAELLALVFDDAGAMIEWQCVTTASGLRAALSTGPVDAVISDYHLPGFDGLQALAIVRERDASLPFVFCCGEIDGAFERAINEAGASACIAKREMWKVPGVVSGLLRRA